GGWTLRGGAVGGSSLVTSLKLRLNSLIPCPNEDPISGIRFAPKTSTSTSSRIRMWLNDRSPNITRLASEDRSGDVVGDRHSHEREQGHVESDRPESDRHHQQVHVDRPERRGQRPGEDLSRRPLRQKAPQEPVAEAAPPDAGGH